MAISTISISSDSSKESVGTPSGQVLWFGRIPTTVPATTPTIDPLVIHDDTSLTPVETPTISPITSTIPPTAPTTHYTSPFIYTDSSDDDTLNTPPSPTHEIPPVEVAPPSSQILPAPFGVRRRRVTILLPGQPILHGQSYCYHPNGPVHMMTVRKRIGPLPTHRLAMRHSVDYSLSDHFTSDESLRDSSSDSSSDTSSDSSSDALSDSSSGHSSSDHSSPALPSSMRSSHQLCSSVLSIPHSSAAITERPSHSSSAGPYRKRSRSPTTSIPLSSHIPGALSSVHADLLPPRKRTTSSDSVTDLEDCSDESSKSSIPRETGLRVDVEAEIDECIAYADALRAEGIDARIVVETVARDKVETSARGTVEVKDDRVTHPMVFDDIPKPTQEGAVKVTYETLGDLVQRFHDHTVEILVHRVQVINSIQRDQGHMIVATGQQGAILSERISELERDNTRLRGMMDVARGLCYDALRTMPNTRSRATMTCEVVNELIDRRVAAALEAHDAARNLEPLVEGGDDYEGGNGGVNENGNDNGDGGVNGNGSFVHVARECTYQDFLKCQPLKFNGTEGVVGFTRWFEKMETVFHISNCPQKYQVKYATCTVLNSALTWWNSHKRTIRVDTAYTMKWTELMKLMTEPTRLQDAIRVANNLMDQKLKGYARNAENKRRFDNNPRDNRGQQPAFKRQNVRGQNVARAYTTGNNVKKGYVRSLPYCNKCKLHHEGPYTVRRRNYKRVGHMARDCIAAVSPNTQRAPIGNQSGIVCYECGKPGHYIKDCPKLRNQNHGNKTGNKTGNKAGNNEATTRAYAIGGGVNPNSNVVKGTFLLNNYYASMLFDSGADSSFVSSTFSALLDVAPSTLDTSYAVELVAGRIS
ncbi:putative reverse transcriptase domain-containing protein [Tanacetum coccineum]|uniref:Reverse transcriptase domain-containing protein n=1 Tax=Tanacetum coccineum TaxID=301880 RepID=A0ABQ5J1L2_9ASTR